MQWVLDRVNILEQDFETAVTNIDQADLALADYLQANNLEQLSWAELVLISGAVNEGNILYNPSDAGFAKLTTDQRVELSRLLRNKSVMEWDYSIRSKRYISNSVDVENETFVLYYSDSIADIEKNSGIGSVMAISVSFFVGFLFSIVWIMVMMWWKKAPELKDED